MRLVHSPSQIHTCYVINQRVLILHAETLSKLLGVPSMHTLCGGIAILRPQISDPISNISPAHEQVSQGLSTLSPAFAVLSTIRRPTQSHRPEAIASSDCVESDQDTETVRFHKSRQVLSNHFHNKRARR